MDKRRAGTLTSEEYQDLLRLTDVAEAIQARRLQDLVELSRLRGISLSALMEELELSR